MLSSAILESIAERILDNCANTLRKHYSLSENWHSILVVNIRIAADIQAAKYQALEVNKIPEYNAFLDTLSSLIQKSNVQIDIDIMRCLAHECACLISLSSQ